MEKNKYKDCILEKSIRNRGITLIALIITVIVMLILVVVTINVATTGGLFESTRSASKDTTYRAEEEELLGYIYDVGVYDVSTGKVDLSQLKTNLETANWNSVILDNEENPTKLTIKKTADGDEHVIYSNGTIGQTTNGTTGQATKTLLEGTYYAHEIEERIEFIIDGDSYIAYNNGQPSGFSAKYSTDEDNKEIYVEYSGNKVIIGKYDVIQNNKIIIADSRNISGYIWLLSTTTDGFEYGLNSEYINESSTLKWSFNSTEHKATLYNFVNNEWILKKQVPYLGYDGKYYIESKCIISDDTYQTFTEYDDSKNQNQKFSKIN